MLRNYDGGILFGNLLPSGESFVCEQWPLSISPVGLYAYVSQAPSNDGRPATTERFVTFEQLRKVEYQGNQLFLNGVLFTRLANIAFARVLANLIQRLRSATPDETCAPNRGRIVASLRRRSHSREAGGFPQMDARLARREFGYGFSRTYLSGVRDLDRPLRRHGAAYVWVFAAPSICRFSFRLLASSALFWADAKRIKQTLIAPISPADAMHALDKLARPLLAEWHPLAAAKVLCSDIVFRERAAEAYRDILYPMLPVCPLDDGPPAAVDAWFRDRFAVAFRTFLAEEGFDSAAAAVPPPPIDITVRSYCERCHGQYVLVVGDCATCGHRPLVPFPRLNTP